MEALLIVLGVPTLLVGAVVIRGYVLATLWAWFMVPVFGLPVLTIPYAIGVSLMVGMMTNHKTGKEPEDDSKKWTPLAMVLIGPFLTLGVAWIVKQFI